MIVIRQKIQRIFDTQCMSILPIYKKLYATGHTQRHDYDWQTHTVNGYIILSLQGLIEI